MITPFENCRSIPKNPIDRYLGEGDRCLRDREKRICACGAGYSDDAWDELKAKHPDWHESVGYYDTKIGGIV